MKTSLTPFCLLAAAVLLSGCATNGTKSTTKSGAPGAASYEPATPSSAAKFAAVDSRAQYSVMCTGLQERRTEDGRLEVAANLLNKENRRIEVQAQCVFKDVQGFAVEESPWQVLILTENSQETVRFTAMNAKSNDYQVRVRASR